MKITPLEIRQKAFEKALRGYDKDEVNAFLLSLSQEWERALDDTKELRAIGMKTRNKGDNCLMLKMLHFMKRLFHALDAEILMYNLYKSFIHSSLESSIILVLYFILIN